MKYLNILYVKATMVSICLSVVTNRAGQGRAGAGLGGQGRHPPTRPAGGPQQSSRWSSCSANFKLASK